VGGVSASALAAVPLQTEAVSYQHSAVSFQSRSDLHLKFCSFGLRSSGIARGSLRPTGLERISGAVAQLGERLICIQEVAGSIPTSSTRVERWSYDPAMGL
jgi:hypothetical protein